MSAVSLIPAALDQCQVPPQELASVPAGVLAVLSTVTDPRARRGVRHGCAAVLGIAVCAVLAGAKSYLAITEWAHDLTPTVRARLGLGRTAPSESTIRRVLQRVDAEQLDLAVCSWLAAQLPGVPDGASDGVRVIAVDGKSARGARCRSEPGGRAVHLLAAFDTTSGAVLGQTVVDGKTNEISAFAPLLDRVDITGAIVTADALCRRRHKASYEDVRVMPTCRPGPRLAATSRSLRLA
ncbi:MAG: ISAs1 family transposase [Mycobacteriales bacterium]